MFTDSLYGRADGNVCPTVGAAESQDCFNSDETGQETAGPRIDTAVDAILDALYAARRVDFRGYRRSTIERRLQHRIAAVGASGYRAYLQLLSRDPTEFDRLITHLTLKVTGFFRNPPVFELLRNHILPTLLANRERLSFWSAGCATGEEPYTLAIMVEELSENGVHNGIVNIVGSDIDCGALEMARSAIYSQAAIASLPAELVGRWFLPQTGNHGTHHVLRGEARRHVHFVQHNIVDSEAPPPEGALFDLILCRNVLIYFQRPLQAQAVDLLHRLLRPGGFLVIGEAESLAEPLEHQYLCLDRRLRVFQKRVAG